MSPRGTGDLAIEAIRQHPEIQVMGLDIVSEMVTIGRRKIEKKHLSGRIRFMLGDAMILPFPDDCFDVAGIAFGIRNIPDRPQALREMKRVVVPRGASHHSGNEFPPSSSVPPVFMIFI